jgi:hypothetical protein
MHAHDQLHMPFIGLLRSVMHHAGFMLAKDIHLSNRGNAKSELALHRCGEYDLSDENHRYTGPI